ncbi:MAG TPA: NAD-dependent epimerase/dehydratase family protein, partial [Acidobacteriota bacterium]|nr:NAD-dependent epimerase/dehydratase family protein [Acidobacteriota bacterium]
MKYVVTGGAGFIGSHVVSALLRHGHDVVVIDNLFSGTRDNLDDALASAGDRAGVLTSLVADILDEDAVHEALDGAQAVFHQAAIASVPRSFDDPASTLRVNIEGTATLLEACRKLGVGRVVMASSSSVYGDSLTLPKHEEMSLAPLSPYALSKRVGEDLLEIWSRQYGTQTVALRYFNIFGPRQDPDSEYAAVVPKFILRMLEGLPPIIFGDGRQSRDFTFVDNAVVANLLAAGIDLDDDRALAPGSRSEVVNIGVGERYSLLELVESLNAILGTSIEPEFAPARVGDVRNSQAAIERAREAIGYVPRVSVGDGLERTVAWYL